MTLFETRSNLLPTTLARMEKPLCSICILEQQSDCLFAERAVARFYWNRHKEFYLASSMQAVRIEVPRLATPRIGCLHTPNC
jgi:hypothetical protein